MNITKLDTRIILVIPPSHEERRKEEEFLLQKVILKGKKNGENYKKISKNKLITNK